jgi:hypothetical protein
VKGDGVGEAATADVLQQREARLVNVGGGDVPPLEGAATELESPAPPHAGPVAAQHRVEKLRLLVGVPLDRAAVRGDGHELLLMPAIVEPLDELRVLDRFHIRERRMRHLGVECGLELVRGSEPLPSLKAHADDSVFRLVAGFGDSVQSELIVGPLDTNLTAEHQTDRLEPLRVERTVFTAIEER